MPTSKQINQAISDFIMKIFTKDRFIELKKQQLSDMDDFEPYVAYNRLVRNEFGGITAKNLKSFLEQNSIIASIKKCEILIEQYNEGKNGVLSYKEFLDIVLPKEHPELRAFITQRECFEINRDEYLSYDTEVALSNLLDLELHLYEDLFEEKKKMDLLGIKEDLIIEVINRRKKNGENINFTNLRIFLGDCGINAYDNEIIGFLRRIDHNDDGIVEVKDLNRFFKRFEPIIKENDTNRRAIVGTSREIIRERSPDRKIVATRVTLVKSKKKRSKSNKRKNRGTTSRSRRDNRVRMSVGVFNLSGIGMTSDSCEKENNKVLNSERIVDSVERYKKKFKVAKVEVMNAPPTSIERKESEVENKEMVSSSLFVQGTPDKKPPVLRGSRAYMRSINRLRQSQRVPSVGRSKEQRKPQIKIRESVNMNLFSSKKESRPTVTTKIRESMNNSVRKESLAPSTKVMDDYSSVGIPDHVFNSISITGGHEINVSKLEKSGPGFDSLESRQRPQLVSFQEKTIKQKMVVPQKLEKSIEISQEVQINNSITPQSQKPEPRIQTLPKITIKGSPSRSPSPREYPQNQQEINATSKGKSLVYTTTNSNGLDYNSIEYNIFKTEDHHTNNSKMDEFAAQDKARRASIYIQNDDPLIIHRVKLENNVASITKNILNESVASTSIGKGSVCGIDDLLNTNSIAISQLEKKVTNSEVCLFSEILIKILKQESEIESLKFDLFNMGDGFCIEDIFKLIDKKKKGQFGFEEFREFVNTLEIEGAGTRNTIDFFGSFDIQQNCYLTIHEFSRIFYPQIKLPEKNTEEKNKLRKERDYLSKVKQILQGQFNIRKLILKAKQLISDNKIDINMIFDYFDPDNKGFTTKEEIFKFLKSLNCDVSMEEVELFISRCTYGEDIHELSFKEFYIFFSL